MDKKLQINDLLSSLQQTGTQPTNNAMAIPDFVTHVDKDRNKKVQAISRKKEEMMKRTSNYEMTKQEMDKWIGIVKLNREKQSLNFVKKDVADMKVNFFPAQPISDFHKKIDDKLKSMNIDSQKAVLKQESQILEKVDPQQAKRRLIEARKHRTTVFNLEQKRRRIAKIKSKLYHKIKKRQKMREEVKKVDQMNPAERNEYIENLTKKRIKQRMTLRHKTKNKHIQNLLRFNRSEKNGIQTSINEVNEQRRKQLERVNQNMMEEISEDYDDENFRNEAMKDLEDQIQALENEEMDIEPTGGNGNTEGLNDLKFMQIGKKNKREQEKKQAYKLLGKLANGQELSQKDVDSEMNDQMSEENAQNNQQKTTGLNGRKVYGKSVGDNHHSYETKQKNKSIQGQLNKYLLTQQQQQDGEENHFAKKDMEEELIDGINLKKLQQKYQPDRIPIDLSTLIAENQDIYQGEDNEAALENMREFQQEKIKEYENEMNASDKANKRNMKGWGSWTGPGIQEKKVDPQEQLRKKLLKIAEIKKNRKDASMAHVTINQSRNKKLSQYFVKNVPRKFANADQFDFMQSEPVGPEWNSLNQFKDNVKPKVITRAGQVIEAVRLPKKIQDLNKN